MTEAVIAGFAAACYASSATSGGGHSTPEQVVESLVDYEDARGTPLHPDEQRAAAAAATWILAFNARWAVGMGDEGVDASSSLAPARTRRHDYLSLRW